MGLNVSIFSTSVEGRASLSGEVAMSEDASPRVLLLQILQQRGTGGDIHGLVPLCVEEAIVRKMKQGKA